MVPSTATAPAVVSDAELLTREFEGLCERLPSEAYANALAAMVALLQTARKNGNGNGKTEEAQQAINGQPIRQAA